MASLPGEKSLRNQNENRKTKNDSKIPESVSITGMRDFGVNGVDEEEQTYERNGPLTIPASAVESVFSLQNKNDNDNTLSEVNPTTNDLDDKLGTDDERIVS